VRSLTEEEPASRKGAESQGFTEQTSEVFLAFLFSFGLWRFVGAFLRDLA